MPSPEAIVAVALIFVVSGVIKSALGFGDALIAVPLLAWTVGLAAARPIFMLVALVLTVAIFIGSFREIDVRGLGPTLVVSVLMVPVGFLAYEQLPEAAMRAGLGLLIMIFGGLRARAPHFELGGRRRGLAGLVAGSLSGVLGGAYNMNGPPLVMYGSMLGWSPGRFRASLQACFLPSALAVLLGHVVTGTIDRSVLVLSAIALPFVLVGGYLGLLLNRRIDAERFARMVGVALVLLGLTLLVQGTRALVA